jgi:predicted transcriptional regulator
MDSKNFLEILTSSMRRSRVKTKAIKLVRDLRASSTPDDLIYRIYVRQKIEAGLADVRSGRIHTHASIRKEFALT